MQSVTLHTNLGDLKIELFCEEAPKTTTNFLALCASNHYDGTTFHRNIRGFMIQGGDPTGTGKGGKSIYDSPNGKFEDEIVDSLTHYKRGICSMANSGPNTNGSQFFITYKAHSHLNGMMKLLASHHEVYLHTSVGSRNLVHSATMDHRVVTIMQVNLQFLDM